MKPTAADRQWRDVSAAMARSAPRLNGWGYHFHSAVVVRIDQFAAGAELRTVVLPTGGCEAKAADLARARRLFRRLRKWAGIRQNTFLDAGRVCDGLFGTVFAHHA